MALIVLNMLYLGPPDANAAYVLKLIQILSSFCCILMFAFALELQQSLTLLVQSALQLTHLNVKVAHC